MGGRTSLRGAKVFAGSRSAGTGATSLLDAQRPALVDLALQTIFSCIRLFCRDHLDEAETTALV